jgi:membrane-associated phospholipid phosphatase
VTVPPARWAMLGALLFAMFLTLGIAVARQPLELDLAVTGVLTGTWHGPAGAVAGVVSGILGPVLPVLLGCGLLIAAGLSLMRDERSRAWLLLRVAIVLVLCRLTSWVAKPLFLRERPRAYPDLSYPSGHVVSVASAGFAAILLFALFAPRLVRGVMAIVAVAIALCALSRLVLGVHWLTDTVGAVFAVTGIGLLSTVVLRLPPAVPLRPVSVEDEAA